MKNKILVIICTFVLCFSLLVIPSFAASNDFAGDYCFNDNLVGLGDYFVDYNPLSFICGDEQFTGFNVFYKGYWVLQYVVKANDVITYSVDVYDSNSGWLDDSYRCIELFSNDISSRLYMFLLDNENIPPVYNGWYYDIYDIIKTALFDDYEINSAQDMAITLVALLLSVGAVLLPVFLILRIGKTLLMSRYM